MGVMFILNLYIYIYIVWIVWNRLGYWFEPITGPVAGFSPTYTVGLDLAQNKRSKKIMGRVWALGPSGPNCVY